MPDEPLWDLFARFVFGVLFLSLSVVTVGPAQAGFSYVLRNYAREEHAFIWGDFKEHAKKNFKQSLIVSLIDIAILILMGIDINIYLRSGLGNGFLMAIAGGFLILALVIFLMMHLYIYPMMVTFHLSVKQLYKNAFLFSILKLFPNLGILILCIGFLVATFWLPIIGFILFFFFTLSFIGLLNNFYVYPILKKHMIDKVDQQVEVIDDVKSLREEIEEEERARQADEEDRDN